MKRIIFLLCLLNVIAFNIKAQAPASFSFQVVVTNAQGKVLPNENVNVTINIVNDSGTSVYQEQFGRVTNNNGLLSLQIGRGDQILNGNLASIDWSKGLFYLRVTLRTSDNSTINLGDVQILSVPFALYAEKTKAPNLVLNGNSLGIEGSNTTVTLPSGSGSSLWDQNATDGVFVNNKVSFKSGSTNYFQAENVPAYGGGVISLYENGNTRNVLGFGELATYSNSGLQLVGISSSSNALDNGGVWVYGNGLPDAKATLLAQKLTNGSSMGRLLLRGSDNKIKAEMSADGTDGSVGYFALYDENGVENLSIGSLETAPNNGAIMMYDANGNARVQLSSYQDINGSHGSLILGGTDNGIKAGLSVDNDNAGSLDLLGANGSVNVNIGAVGGSGYENSGGVWTYDGNGNIMASLSVLNGYPSNPYFSLRYNGSPKGSFYVDTDGKSVLSVDKLIVSGVLRSSTADVSAEYMLRSGTAPNNTCYVSQNVDEITLRGTASLQNGTAVIELPGEISEKIDLNTITVQATPLSAESKGIAVTDKQTVSFKVQELMSGTGNYAFDWRLTAQVKASLKSAPQRIELPEVAMPTKDIKDGKPVFGKIVSIGKSESVSQVKKIIGNNSIEKIQKEK